MSANIEIKASINDCEAMRQKLLLLTNSFPSRLLQHDTFYKFPNARLKYRRCNDEKEIILYYRDDTKCAKRSTYYRLKISLVLLIFLWPLSKIWPKRGDVKKSRELYMLNDTRIHLDHVEGLGDFIELEVLLSNLATVSNGKARASELIDYLEIDEKNFLPGAYLDLLNTTVK